MNKWYQTKYVHIMKQSLSIDLFSDSI